MKQYLAKTCCPMYSEDFISTTRVFDTAEEALEYADTVEKESQGEILVDVYEAIQIH